MAYTDNGLGFLSQALATGADAYRRAQEERDRKQREEEDRQRKIAAEDTAESRAAGRYGMEQQAFEKSQKASVPAYEMAVAKAQQEQDKSDKIYMMNTVGEFVRNADIARDLPAANMSVKKLFPNTDYLGTDAKGDYQFRTTSEGKPTEFSIGRQDLLDAVQANDPAALDKITIRRAESQQRIAQGQANLAIRKEQLAQKWKQLDIMAQRAAQMAGGKAGNTSTALLKNIEGLTSEYERQNMDPAEARRKAVDVATGQLPKAKDMDASERSWVKMMVQSLESDYSPEAAQLKESLRRKMQEGITKATTRRTPSSTSSRVKDQFPPDQENITWRWAVNRQTGERRKFPISSK